MTHGEQAKYNFEHGYNCAQAVLLAFSDLTGLDETTALKLASSFGGGMGRLREVCGAVSGMFMVAGLLFDGGIVGVQEAKAAHYARIQTLAARFREKNGSYICRELIANVKTPTGPVPEPRTPEYYQKRSCADLCRCAAELLDEMLLEAK